MIPFDQLPQEQVSAYQQALDSLIVYKPLPKPPTVRYSVMVQAQEMTKALECVVAKMAAWQEEWQSPYFPSGSIFTGSRVAPEGKGSVACVQLPYLYRNELEALSDPVETFRQQRKLVIKEREAWAAHKKSGKDYEPKFAKKNEKFFLQCERACTLMIGYYQTDGHYDNWPIELAPALEHMISAVVHGIWSSQNIDIVLEAV